MNAVPFSEMELSQPLMRAVEEMGFESATEIQAQTIPLLCQGLDVIGRSQTGTGKTLAFGIPAVDLVDTGECKNDVQVLILCPTRELSMQACDEIRKLAKFKPGVKTLDVYGGAPMSRQIFGLRNGANIVVGTPGRIMDHLRRRTLKLENLKMVILDEADEMLSMGFKEDIETILTTTPQERQTVLFSATMPAEILALTNQFQRDPQLVEIDRKQPSVKTIHQYYYDVPRDRKDDALSLILMAKDPKLAIIFCNTKKMTEDLSVRLKKQGFKAQGLNGDMKQVQRTQVMNDFKAHTIRILVATDVAARGIDVDGIDYVINYDIPQDMEYYIHRIGRTGRAGKEGDAITLCCGRKQVQTLEQIARIVRSTITREKIPTPADIGTRLEQANLERVENMIKAAQDMPFMGMVEALASRGYTPEIIAAAALEMKFGGRRLALPEIIEERSRAPKDDPSAMVKVVISLGRAQHIAPNHVVGAIAEMTELSGRDIGKIEIHDDRTLVSLPRDSAGHVVERMRSCKICGQSAGVSLLAEGRPFRSAPPRGGRPEPRRREFHGTKAHSLDKTKKRAPRREWDNG